MLVNGRWERNWDPVQKQDAQGRFLRQSSTFRGQPTAAEITALVQGAADAPQYTLLAAYICPWASRALIARDLLGLASFIDVRITEPALTDYGWRLAGVAKKVEKDAGSAVSSLDQVEYIHELYTQSDPAFTGRATVPVLWDERSGRIVNNESADILRIFNQQMRPLHQSELDLYPPALQRQIDAFNEQIYHSLNNGVYRAGFATTQVAYAEACGEVFAQLDQLEQHFAEHQFAVADQLTESDIRLFVTLVRFDLAYYGLFKTNRQSLQSYAALSAYLERLLQIPAFRDNTRVEHIKAGYYSIKALNPTGIVPQGPQLPWLKLLER